MLICFIQHGPYGMLTEQKYPNRTVRSIYLKISDMAVMLGISATQLREDIADKSTEVSRRYHRGKAASRVKLLHQEMQLAYVGSPLALENTRNNLLDMEDDE